MVRRWADIRTIKAYIVTEIIGLVLDPILHILCNLRRNFQQRTTRTFFLFPYAVHDDDDECTS